MMPNKFIIYADGACSGNPGPGGWGALILVENGNDKELSGFEKLTTNNRMELLAAIKAIDYFDERETITLVTDSVYVKNGITTWIHNWKKNGWMTANKKPVKNVDLWQQLDELSSSHNISWEWVKGHSNHPENDRADLLARNAILENNLLCDK